MRLDRFLIVLFLSAAAAVGAPRPSRAADVARLMEDGHWRRARAALEADPATAGDAVAQGRLARVLQVLGESETALAHAERAVALAPQSAEAHFRLAEVLGEKAQKAGALGKLGLAKRFKKEAETAAALDPNHVDARLDLISFHLIAPGLAGGDKKKVPALIKQIEAADPSQAWRAHMRLAGENKDSTAVDAITRDAVARHPNQYEARIARANQCLPAWRNRRAEAEEQARAAVALEPGRVGGYTVLAVVLAGSRRWDELERLLSQAEAQVPDDLSPFYAAGRTALVEAQDAARAERWFRRYLSQPAEGGAVTHAAAHWRLAQVLDQLGRRSDAIAALQASIRLDPKFEPARKDLKRLRS
jgi:tetratricopeptide (TPR) repeat protein